MSKLQKDSKRAFIVAFEDGNQPTVREEAGELRKIAINNTDAEKRIEEKKIIIRDYCWINDIDYKGYFISRTERRESVADDEGEIKNGGNRPHSKTINFRHLKVLLAAF